MKKHHLKIKYFYVIMEFMMNLFVMLNVRQVTLTWRGQIYSDEEGR